MLGELLFVSMVPRPPIKPTFREQSPHSTGQGELKFPGGLRGR